MLVVEDESDFMCFCKMCTAANMNKAGPTKQANTKHHTKPPRTFEATTHM